MPPANVFISLSNLEAISAVLASVALLCKVKLGKQRWLQTSDKIRELEATLRYNCWNFRQTCDKF